MVTKQRHQQLRRLVLQTYQGEKTQWDNIDEALKAAGFRPDAQARRR